mmetsp:Transcript_9721/g.36477  ORF Transcript_9721/g.36477 Transcript_9721/m.36477 type:complete len:338 (+) Transcript_9721:129-1142(+)
MDDPTIKLLTSPVVRVGAAWISSSVVLSTYSNTAFLQAGASGWQLTMTRFVGSLLLGFAQQVLVAASARPTKRSGSLSLTSDALMSPPRLFKKHAKTYLLPALSLLSANLFNSMALKNTGITITYVTKCVIPIFTSLLCLLGFGPHPSKNLSSIASMAVLCTGIALASAGNSSFHLPGFIFALISSISQSFLTVFSKQASNASGLTGPQAQFVMATLGLLGLQGMQVVKTIGATSLGRQTTVQIVEAAKTADEVRRGMTALAPLGALAAVAGYLEYSLNFGFISLVTPSFAAVVDGVRRAGIVTAGNLMFAEAALSRWNHLGILLAITGGVAYSVSS